MTMASHNGDVSTVRRQMEAGRTSRLLIALAVIFYLFVRGIVHAAALSWGLSVAEVMASTPEIPVGVSFAVVVVGMAFGASRLLRRHPLVAAPGYDRWLVTTPWRPGCRLPFGPVYPTWRDAVLLFVLAIAMSIDANATAFLMLPAGYCLGYALAAVRIVPGVAPWSPLGLCLWLLLVILALWLHVAAVAIGVGLVMIAALCTVRRSLESLWVRGLSGGDGDRLHWRREAVARAGEPYVTLLPVSGPSLWSQWFPPAFWAVWLPAWCSAAFFVLAYHMFHGSSNGASLAADSVGSAEPVEVGAAGTLVFWFMFMTSVCLAGGFRYGLYRLHPPISWWGRWRLRRWRVPGYDRCLRPIVIAWFLGMSLPWILFLCRLPDWLAFGLSALVVVGLLTLLGPSGKAWRLTGQFSVDIAARSKAWQRADERRREAAEQRARARGAR